MKVQEKGTDRRAELHVHVQGQVEELAEYGQYIDAQDQAICCYVPVEDGNIIKIGGRFHGTTLSVYWDLHVDGVLRKANNMISKAVKQQKNIKLDFEEALYQTDDGLGDTKTLDTQMKIVPVSGISFFLDETKAETIGTIEVRLYVLRTFGAEYILDSNVTTYLDNEDDEEKDVRKKAPYKMARPEYMVEFEKNCQELDRKASNAWKKRLRSKRPNKEPWATFRFHYRSKEAIEAQNMKLSYHPKTKGKGTIPQILNLDPLPPLIAGAKPAKPHDGGSTRTGSPTPIPGTPFFERRPSPLAERQSATEGAPSETIVVNEPTNETDSCEPIDEKTEELLKLTEEKSGELSKRAKATPSLPTPVVLTPLVWAAPPAPMLSKPPPLKRPAVDEPLTLTPESKRNKPLSIAETRRQLKAIKARRENLAKKRLDLESELGPYMPQIREEQAKLARELEEETRMWKEENQALRDESAILAEMKRVASGL